MDALKDDINKALQSLLNDHIKSDAGPLQKGGEQNCVSIYYVPVTENGYRSNLYVVEIEVIRDWGFCRDHIYYSKSWTPKRGGDKDFAGKKALNDFYKVKDEFYEVAIRTNGASCCVKQVDVDRDVKKPLEVKYKEWRQTTKKDAREIPDELGLEEADVRRLSIAVRKRLCELNRKEYGYVLLANKVPAKYRGTAHLSFLQNIPCVAVFDLFDPSSKQNGLHFACNEMTDAPRANIRTLDDFKDVIPDKDSFVSIRGTTWILSNADMQNEGWIKCSKDSMWRALSAYKQCFNPGRLLFIFLIFSETAVEEMADIVECSFSILGNTAGSCATILSEDKSAAEAIINASKPSLRKELTGCSITGITWSLLKEIVREMVEPSKFEERGATTDLPYYNGYLREVPIKTVLSMDDLEVYCPNPRLPTSAEAIAKERDAFYKGAQASQMNLYYKHSIPRSLEGKVNTKLEKALNSLSKESIDANYYVKTVTVSYEPGAGATTLCRRIIWSKRNEYRCALVKAITQSTDFQIDKLQNIGYDEMNKTYSLPVLVLVDNFPEGDVRLLTEHIMKRQTKCVLLTTLPISKSVSDSKFEITLGKLDETETNLVKGILITITNDSGRRLEAEKVLERERRFIWFGLELFGREYLKIKERLQKHIHSILTTLRNDSREEPQTLLDMCCFLNKYSDGSIILPNSLVLDFLYERNSLEQPRLQEVHDVFGGILLEEQNETHGYYGWRPAHSLVSEVVTSRITSVDTARRSLEIIRKATAYVVKPLRHQVFRMFLERKRLSDPVLMEEQAVDDRAVGFDIENEVFGFYGKRTKYSRVIVDILGEENNVEGALSVLLEICEQATQTEDKSYAWQQLARFIGYEMRANDMNKQTDLLERLHKAMMKELRIEFRMPERGIDAAHTAIDIAISNQPTFTNHYTTKGVLYLTQLTDLKAPQSRSVPEGIEICRKAFSVYGKALEASRKPNHFAMIGKIQAIISLLEIVKDLPCFQPDGMFMAYLRKEKIPLEMQDVLSNEDQDYVQNLSQTTHDILNELFGSIKLTQSTTYDENEIKSLNNAKIRASKLRRKFYEITKFDKMELGNEEYSMSLSSTTSQDLQQKVQDILFINDETTYSTWSHLSNSDVERIYQMLKFLCSRGLGSHNDMLICSKACLHLKDKPSVQDLDDLVSLWVKKFPNSEWAHLFYYMIHFPVPNGSLAPCTTSAKESIKKCSKIVQEKAGSGFRRSGAEYFLGKGRGLDAIISGHEFQGLKTKWKTKTEFWRGREPTERLERVKGQKDLGSKGIISYQGIQLHFDNTLYPNESKDDLWFYVGFTFAGPYAYDPVDNDTYMSLTNGNHATQRKERSSKYSTPPRGLQERASAREHEVDRTTRNTNRSSEFLQKTPLYARDLDKDEKNDWFVVGGRFGPLCESAEKPSKEENKLTRFPHRPENRTSRDRFEAKRSEPNLGNVKTIVGTRGTEKKHFNLTSTAPDGKVHHGAYVCGANKSTECIKHTSWKDDSFTDRCNFAHSWKGDTLQFVCTKCTESKLSFCKEKVKHQEFIWNLGPYYNRYGEFWKRTSPRPIGNTASFDSGGSASSSERTPPPVREKPMSCGSLDWSEQFRDSGRIDWFDD